MRLKNNRRIKIKRVPKCIIKKYNSGKGISIVIKKQRPRKNNNEDIDKGFKRNRLVAGVRAKTNNINKPTINIGIKGYKIEKNAAIVEKHKNYKTANVDKRNPKDSSTQRGKYRKDPQFAGRRLYQTYSINRH